MSWVAPTCGLHSHDICDDLSFPSWEILSNLSYEYSVIMGKHKLTWTFLVCLFPSFQPESQDQKIYWTPSDLFGMSLVPFVFNHVPVSRI